jgi:hypothetical protein
MEQNWWLLTCDKSNEPVGCFPLMDKARGHAYRLGLEKFSIAPVEVSWKLLSCLPSLPDALDSSPVLPSVGLFPDNK